MVYASSSQKIAFSPPYGERSTHVLRHAEGVRGAWKWFLTIRITFPILLLIVLGCSSPSNNSLLILSFETDNDLDHIKWSCRTWFERSSENVTHGKKSLKAELPASEKYPGVTINNRNLNWKGYDFLEFDLYIPENTHRFSIRIDDKEDPVSNDWFWARLNLQSGMNHVRIPLDQIRSYSSQRPINKAGVKRIILYTTNLPDNYTIYLDNLRVTTSETS